LEQITRDEVEKLKFPGSASNGNNALRTLRRMFTRAKEGKLVYEVPDFALFKEHGLSLRLNDEAERRLLALAGQPLKDIIVVMRDTGMRNVRELYCMRVENVNFDAATIFTPNIKTKSGRRFIPMSSRVMEILEARCAGRSEGWVWISRFKGKHIGEGMVYRQWAQARQAAGLPRELVLYCARHDFGSFVLAKTGNLKAVMNAMGHGDVRSAMLYQHPDGEVIRNALNARRLPRPTVPHNNQANA
jgi:integrase